LSDALQIGGGINEDNALDWIKAGAEKVIHIHTKLPRAFSQRIFFFLLFGT